MQLILSIFPGIDLLGRAFEAEGFCVVRGPDLIFGGDIRTFHPPAGKFSGIIGGSPCQDFSRLRRTQATGLGAEMLDEFARVIGEARPDWFLLENVPAAPDLVGASLFEYGKIQRVDIDGRECGCRQRRLRHFQFGSLIGRPLIVTRRREFVTTQRAALASEGTRQGRRSWEKFCALQGLPPLELPGWSIKAKYRAVGNGVPITMGRTLAAAILQWQCEPEGFLTSRKPCGCGCGRPVGQRSTYALPCCRKRMQRRRDLVAGRERRRVTQLA
jgi:DNA (cytosine-5)-methyltransferase 1